MGIGGIESGIGVASVRTYSPSAPEITSVQAVTPVAENQVKVVKTSESSNNSNSGTGSQNQAAEEQLMSEGKPIHEVSPDKIESAIKDINSKIKPTHTECQFSYHEKTKRISIKVMDQDSGEVIREIPPEKALDMLAKTLELAGILVDEKR